MNHCDCNIYNTTAAPASPLERGPGETNNRVLDSGKNNIEKHVSFNTSSSLEPPLPKIPRRVLMHTYLFQKEICLDVGVENLAWGIVHPTSALLDSGANRIFIDQVWAERIGLPLVKLDVSIPVSITLMYQGHRERVTAEATQLGKINLILGWTVRFLYPIPS
ncbi:hypothetical protein SERLA73DRAFT_74231 [Serpula lacrymans var. lacrymans S7.3]|uniref:Peptidase A2 domain-containing protein n=2 Tax=Serpula lacrymans var. lacrymans TaxID=341189 RepID=F8Q0Z4_SERL3|nr:uncharacterized protein SERLADRAFT_438881 [Serpula lacrymans var. lacrymans S7.9]EGN97972.1 hypothetical protein SERLA73DRAFT_74231 [Serpula lacrymans var. lacrymans S7.3]EGO23559.1 hypothetical protein SERLADRAFT_438881 [Serpula lacrymans var. lacrymans S7.9]